MRSKLTPLGGGFLCCAHAWPVGVQHVFISARTPQQPVDKSHLIVTV